MGYQIDNSPYTGYFLCRESSRGPIFNRNGVLCDKYMKATGIGSWAQCDAHPFRSFIIDPYRAGYWLRPPKEVIEWANEL